MTDRVVTDVVDAIVDGTPVDWPAAEARLSSSGHGTLAAELKTLSQVARASRIPAPAPARRFTLTWLGAQHALAIACACLGLACEIAALAQTGSGKLLIITATTTVFAACAAFLDLSRDRRAHILAACYWTVSAAFGASGLIWVSRTWPWVPGLTLAAALRPEAFFSAALWQFARVFPQTARFGLVDRICTVAYRTAFTAGLALFAINLLPVLGPAASPAWVLPFQRASGYALGFFLILFVSALLALVAMACRARASEGEENRRVRRFLLGIAAGFAPVLAITIAEALFPAFEQLMLTPPAQRWGSYVVYPPLFVVPVFTAYAVAVQNVLSIRVVIQRSTRYLLTRWIVMWGGVIPLLVLARHLYLHADRPLGASLTLPPAPALLWISVAALALLTGRNRILRLIDRWTLPDLEDSSVMLAEMTTRMKDTRTPLEIAMVLARGIERALQAPTETYLVTEGALVATSSTGSFPRTSESLIPLVLESTRGPCVVRAGDAHSYYSLLSESDRDWIAREDVTSIVPILANRGRSGLVAVIALKTRRNALSFSRNDLRFLGAAAVAASLACDALQPATPAQQETAEDDELAIECARCGHVVKSFDANTACDCGDTSWQPALVPQQIGDRFRVTRRLGSGGMGVVYRATDLSLSRTVAIKTLPRLSESASARLREEARVMAGLSHAHIAVLFGIEEWRQTPLLVMEHLTGGSLAVVLRRGPMPVAEALGMVRKLAASLEYVHAAGRYHGDIKPSNIGFTADRTPKFLDFGLSRAIRPANDGANPQPNPFQAQFVVGTPAYFSPEVAAGEEAGPALDLWALCVVLWESLTARHAGAAGRSDRPFDTTDPRCWQQLKDVAPAPLVMFLTSALAVDPRSRPQSAAELAHAIDGLNAGSQ